MGDTRKIVETVIHWAPIVMCPAVGTLNSHCTCAYVTLKCSFKGQGDYPCSHATAEGLSPLVSHSVIRTLLRTYVATVRGVKKLSSTGAGTDTDTGTDTGAIDNT